MVEKERDTQHSYKATKLSRLAMDHSECKAFCYFRGKICYLGATLPHDHAPKSTKNHRVSEHIVEEFCERKIAGVENHRPSPRIQANERKSVPDWEHWRVGSNFSPKHQNAHEVHVKVECREENRGRLLKCEEPHKRPLSVKLWNAPLPGNESFSRLMHASVKILWTFIHQRRLNSSLACICIRPGNSTGSCSRRRLSRSSWTSTTRTDDRLCSPPFPSCITRHLKRFVW